MTLVQVFAIVLLVVALVLLVGAEWPRVSARVGADARTARARQRKKEKFALLRGERPDDDDFAASVERDLANLPTIEERDGRSRR